jgi:hypothetical protein
VGTRTATLVLLVILSSLPRLHSQSNPANSFTFLHPVIQFSDTERRTLDGRDVVLKILPATGHELAAVAATSLIAGPDTLLESARNIVYLKRSAMVPQLGRFSEQPRVDDVNGLTLEDVDIATIRRCEPDRCGLKLESDEITRLKTAAASGGQNSQSAIEQEFRRLITNRATRYLSDGDTAGASEFSTLLDHAPYLQSRMPQLAAYLRQFPRAKLPGSDSFLYWSKELYTWKPMITVTHVTMLRGDGQPGSPEAVVVARDIFSTRYTSGSLTVSMIFPSPNASSRRYLVYVNHTWVDSLRGLWRPFVERRIKNQARKIFADTRDRIEHSGTAPGRTARMEPES